MIPVVEVVAAVLATQLLPRHMVHGRLVLHHNALLEGGVMVLAIVTAIHGDLESVQLFLRVNSRLEDIVWLANVVVPKCHFRKC